MFHAVARALLVGGAIVGLGLAGCDEGRSNHASPESAPTRAVSVSVLTLDNPYFVKLTEEMKAKGAERGFTVEVVSASLDPAKQARQVAGFIERGVDAIVLCPVDSVLIGPSVAAANEAKIPVFTADIAVTAEGADVVCHVATDNFLGGELAAEVMVEALAGPGEVAVIDHPEVESANQRTRGFEKRLAELNAEGAGPVELVAKRPGQGTTDQGRVAAESILQAYPTIAGIFAINDPSALGVVAALGDAGRLNDGVAVIGFDGAEEAVEALQAGYIDADIVQHPDMIGWRVIDAISDHLVGRPVEPVQLLRPTVIRAADLAPSTAQGDSG